MESYRVDSGSIKTRVLFLKFYANLYNMYIKHTFFLIYVRTGFYHRKKERNIGELKGWKILYEKIQIDSPSMKIYCPDIFIRGLLDHGTSMRVIVWAYRCFLSFDICFLFLNFHVSLNAFKITFFFYCKTVVQPLFIKFNFRTWK